VARFKDLVSGISVREDTDEATGMTQKIVSDWRSAPKGGDLKPEIIVMDPATGDPVRNEAGQSDHLSMSVDAILSVEDGQETAAGRRGGAYPARRCQDQGHHRGSSPRGGTVRGPSPEGSRDHRGIRRLCPLWQGLQEQAPHHRRTGR
jgi:hypothetical protein